MSSSLWSSSASCSQAGPSSTTTTTTSSSTSTSMSRKCKSISNLHIPIQVHEITGRSKFGRLSKCRTRVYYPHTLAYDGVDANDNHFSTSTHSLDATSTPYDCYPLNLSEEELDEFDYGSLSDPELSPTTSSGDCHHHIWRYGEVTTSEILKAMTTFSKFSQTITRCWWISSRKKAISNVWNTLNSIPVTALPRVDEDDLGVDVEEGEGLEMLNIFRRELEETTDLAARILSLSSWYNPFFVTSSWRLQYKLHHVAVFS
ncbi:hypothetical protein ABKN59_009535 [Abortiporus biennis]